MMEFPLDQQFRYIKSKNTYPLALGCQTGCSVCCVDYVFDKEIHSRNAQAWNGSSDDIFVINVMQDRLETMRLRSLKYEIIIAPAPPPPQTVRMLFSSFSLIVT